MLDGLTKKIIKDIFTQKIKLKDEKTRKILADAFQLNDKELKALTRLAEWIRGYGLDLGN